MWHAEKAWNDDSPVNINKEWFPMVSKWCRISCIHSMGPLSATAAPTQEPVSRRPSLVVV